jgi:hypothetical protein
VNATAVVRSTLRMLRSIVRTGVQTEYAGTGRVRFVSFGGGAGYVTVLRRGRGRDGRPVSEPGFRPNVVLPGFTLYIRTAPTSNIRRASVWHRALGRVLLTRDGNVDLWADGAVPLQDPEPDHSIPYDGCAACGEAFCDGCDR